MKMSRRELLRQGFGAVVAVPAVAVAVKAFGAGLVFIDPNDGLAKALGYVEDANTSKDRKDKTASCANCSVYTAVNGEKGGKCTILGGKNVHEGGWCKSWSKKKA